MKNMNYVALLMTGLSCAALQGGAKPDHNIGGPATWTPAPTTKPRIIGGSPATWTPPHIQQLEDAKYQVKVAQQNVESAIEAAFADKDINNTLATHIMGLEKNDRKPYFKAISYSAPLIGAPKQADLVQAITKISSLKGGAKKHADRVNNFIDYLMSLDTQARSNFFKILDKGCSTDEIDWDTQEDVSCTQHVYNLQMALEKLSSKQRSQNALEQNISRPNPIQR